MKLKTIAMATGVLFILAVLALVLDRQSSSIHREGLSGSKLMHGVDLAQVGSIRIEKNASVVTLKGSAEGWLVTEMQAFPADEEKIRDTLVKLSEQAVEHKVTAKAERLGELGLLKISENADKFEEGKTAYSLTLADPTGATLFELLIGNERRNNTNSSGYGGQYIRLPSETAAYLIPESISLPAEPQEWLDTGVFSFEDKNLIQQISIARQGRKKLRFSRADDKAKWQLEGVNAEQLEEKKVSDLAQRIASLDLFKVGAPDISPKDMGREKTGQVDIQLFDKRSYTITIGEAKAEDTVRYLTLAASLDSAVQDEALRKEVDTFNKRFQNRYLGVYDFDGEQLLKSQKDFIKNPTNDKKK